MTTTTYTTKTQLPSKRNKLTCLKLVKIKDHYHHQQQKQQQQQQQQQR